MDWFFCVHTPRLLIFMLFGSDWHLCIVIYLQVTDRPIYVSESDILGPNGILSDIKNLVSFERELFEDSSYKYRIKIFLLFMSISPLWNSRLNHHERCSCQLYGHYSLINILVVILIRQFCKDMIYLYHL